MHHRKLSDIITLTTATVTALLALQSCIYDNAPLADEGNDITDTSAASIRVNTMLAGANQHMPQQPQSEDGSGESFTVLFWRNPENLINDVSTDGEYTDYTFWLAPYLSAKAPKAVSEYKSLTFDTNYPYPMPEGIKIYATGYAPADVLAPDTAQGYRRLNATVDATLPDGSTRKGHYDFLGCDAWNEVYYGSHYSPFAQERNRLYFRHLASKLVFYAKRDQASMENKQFVRFVEITDIKMSVDGGTTWLPLHTPSAFEWDRFPSDKEFPDAYTKAITAVQKLTGVTTTPAAGYKTIASEALPDDYKIVRRTADGKDRSVDRVPIDGHTIDSCYICNRYVDGTPQLGNGKAIKLSMTITAELSFDQSFPKSDKDGSTTDDLTFTRIWADMMTDIHEVNVDGTANTSKPVTELKPGKEYRIYLNFSRTGVNLVARELPWNYGGIHYVGIIGSDPDPTPAT